MVTKKRSTCLFCSLGCGTLFRTAGEHVTAIDYDKDHPVNHGSLCPRGNYNFELLNHPQRLTEPQIGQRKVSWGEAFSFLRQGLKGCDPDSVGIVLSSISSNESAYMAAKLAKVLGIKNIAAAGDAADLEAYAGYKAEVSGAKLAKADEIDKNEALLIIGDVLTRAPVLSQQINKVKYGKRGNQILVIDPNDTHTSWFATTHLKNKPGTEAMLLAAMLKIVAEENKKSKLDVNLEKVSKAVGVPQESIVKAARDFNAASSGTIIFVPRETSERNDLIGHFIKALASLSPNKKFITFYGFGNTLGVNTILDRSIEGHTTYSELIGKLEKGQLKALFMLGEDLSASHPDLIKKMKQLKFIAMSNYFATDLVDEAVLLLPLASHLEDSATYTLADGRVEELSPVGPRVGAKSNLDILAALLNAGGELSKITQQTKELLADGVPMVKADLKQALADAEKIKGRGEVSQLEITHFGNNSLVKNFFWYRVNSKNG